MIDDRLLGTEVPYFSTQRPLAFLGFRRNRSSATYACIGLPRFQTVSAASVKMPSGLLRCVVLRKWADVAEAFVAFIDRTINIIDINRPIFVNLGMVTMPF
jgi:hypothetical protein